MAAAKKNLVIEQGSTFIKRFIYKNQIPLPVDLTGFSAKMQIRLPAGALITDLSTDNGKIVLGGSSGTIDLTITASETSGFNFNNAYYDLKLIDAGGVPRRLVEGIVTLSPGQTL